MIWQARFALRFKRSSQVELQLLCSKIFHLLISLVILLSEVLNFEALTVFWPACRSKTLRLSVYVENDYGDCLLLLKHIFNIKSSFSEMTLKKDRKFQCLM